MQAPTRRKQRPADTRRTAHRPLDALLADMVREHEALAAATGAQREALRRADPHELAASREALSDACSRIAALEDERRALVAAISPERPDATLSSLAGTLPEPSRTRALESASRLRELVSATGAEQRRLHAATDSMLRHVRGMVQHIQRSMNHAGVYGRAGRVEPGASVVSGIDLTR